MIRDPKCEFCASKFITCRYHYHQNILPSELTTIFATRLSVFVRGVSVPAVTAYKIGLQIWWLVEFLVIMIYTCYELAIHVICKLPKGEFVLCSAELPFRARKRRLYWYHIVVIVLDAEFAWGRKEFTNSHGIHGHSMCVFRIPFMYSHVFP